MARLLRGGAFLGPTSALPPPGEFEERRRAADGVDAMRVEVLADPLAQFGMALMFGIDDGREEFLSPGEADRRSPALELEAGACHSGGMSSPEKIARVRIGLKEIEPEIWRRVEVPLGMSLKGLHDVIQAVFGWQNYHLFEFQVGAKRYGIPDPEWDGERQVAQARLMKLGALIAKGIDHFDYTYDFGDDWEHAVTIEAVVEADPAVKYPRFVDGARRGPPEDVGSIPGYYEFIEAMSKPRHPEHRRMLEWHGGPYDPGDIGLFDLRLRLGAIAKRRHAGTIAYAKGKAKP